MTRPIDDVGRLVIPKELRDLLNWQHKDQITITPQGKKLILGKLEASCGLCESEADLITLPGGSMVCASCIKTMADVAIAHKI